MSIEVVFPEKILNLSEKYFCEAEELIKNLSLKKKALPTTFLPSVKTLTKNISIVFLLAQVFFL
jgi:hypothetical protein